MSKWTDIRDGVVDALKVSDIGSNLKTDFVKWLESEGIEFAQKFVDRIIEECKSDAPKESGWCRIRDAFVIPTVLNVAMYVLQLVLAKAAAETEK